MSRQIPDSVCVLTGEDFFHQYGAGLGVSRETYQKLQIYVDLLGAWNRHHNLVGKTTMRDPWRRHILDSAQIKPLLETFPVSGNAPRPVVDLGSGAGFPGLVLAIITGFPVILIESKQKKCAFLKTVAQETDTSVVIKSGRIEHMDKMAVSVVTARALAPLETLLGYVQHIGDKETGLIALKGRHWQHEKNCAYTRWRFTCQAKTSLSDPEGRILSINNIQAKP